MNRIIQLFLIVAVGVLTLVGCQDLSGQSSPLAGTSWRLVSLGPDWPVDASDGVSLAFDLEGFARGSTGCNEFNGPYEADGSLIELGPLMVTERACQEAFKMDQERNYLEALSVAGKYTLLDGGQRLLISATDGRKPLEFSRIK
jgi:heat shock protein HslJ